VTGLRDATSISVGWDFACAIAAGTAMCWGANMSGQLGVGTTSGHETPVAVAGLVGAVEIETGYEYACARDAPGNVSCWGENDGGQLGYASHGVCYGHPCATSPADPESEVVAQPMDPIVSTASFCAAHTPTPSVSCKTGLHRTTFAKGTTPFTSAEWIRVQYNPTEEWWLVLTIGADTWVAHEPEAHSPESVGVGQHWTTSISRLAIAAHETPSADYVFARPAYDSPTSGSSNVVVLCGRPKASGKTSCASFRSARTDGVAKETDVAFGDPTRVTAYQGDFGAPVRVVFP
jgi:hypothetical protein